MLNVTMLSVANNPFMLSVIMLSVAFAECCMLSVACAECCCAEYHYVKCRCAI
jgi:hypothetical protein